MKVEIQNINEAVGLPEGIFEWIYFINDVLVDHIYEFLQLLKKDKIKFMGKTEIEGKNYNSFSVSYDIDKMKLNKLIIKKFKDNNIKLRNLYLSFDVTIIPDKIFSFDFFNAYYNDSAAYFDDKAYLYDATLYFDIFLPFKTMKIKNREDLEELLEEYKFKRFIYGHIAHELTHSYEFLNRKISGKYEFGDRILNFLVYLLKNHEITEISDDWEEFLNLIYLSLSFEVNARVSQVYLYVSDGEITDSDEFLKEVKDTEPWRDMTKLKDFDADDFYKDFQINLTNKEVRETFKEIGIYNEKELEGEVNYLVLKYLVNLWNEYIDIVNKEFKKEKLKKLPKKMLDNPQLFLKYYELKFHKASHGFFNKIYKMIADF
jgi:hypothetical protein